MTSERRVDPPRIVPQLLSHANGRPALIARPIAKRSIPSHSRRRVTENRRLLVQKTKFCRRNSPIAFLTVAFLTVAFLTVTLR